MNVHLSLWTHFVQAMFHFMGHGSAIIINQAVVTNRDVARVKEGDVSKISLPALRTSSVYIGQILKIKTKLSHLPASARIKILATLLLLKERYFKMGLIPSEYLTQAELCEGCVRGV